jgi:outer membrane protein OmpA-like peptidoglycan-associated protein
LAKKPLVFTLNVTFENNSKILKSDKRSEVSKLAEFMAQYPETQVVLSGYTDSIGSAAYNQKLSKQRAITLQDLLISEYKIEASRLSAIGRGEASPVASNQTNERRALNRRVEANVKTLPVAPVHTAAVDEE